MSSTDEQNPSIYVTLVHGTFAREADWTSEGSQFRRQLQSEFSLPLVFDSFQWSGGNTHTDRLRAGADLRKRLHEIRRARPLAKHFVVAHSHGGNVACYALQDDSLRTALAGLICLGTPFLLVRNYRLPRSLFAAASFWFVATYGQVARPLLHLPFDPLTYGLIAFTTLPLLYLLGLLAWQLVRSGSQRVSLGVLLRGRRELTLLARELAIPLLPSDRFVAIRIDGDEAAMVLATSQFFGWFLRVVWSRLEPFWKAIESKTWYSVLFISWLMTSPLGRAFLSLQLGAPFDLSREDSVVYRALRLIMSLSALCICLMGYLLFTLMLLMQSVFGLDSMLWSLDLLTTAEPSPPGEAVVMLTLEDSDESKRALGGVRSRLRHSQLYELIGVQGAVASWGRARIGATDTLADRQHVPPKG